MFDLDSIWQLAKIEPGHNIAQCFLLFMIWLTSRGIRKDLAGHENKIQDHEVRIVKLESKK